MRRKVGIVSLGCDKNRIDSEIVVGNLNAKYDITNDPKKADIIIVNTCGFIEAAKQESIDTILEMADYKKKSKCSLLIVTGCLAQRYSKDLIKLIPEIDILLGVNNYNELENYIEEYFNAGKNKILCDFSDTNINEGNRVITTGKYTAYIRIAEGCNNNCTYCIIPKIRGKYRSRTIENIINEAEMLSLNGVKEIIIVAQDTTMYGVDIYGEKKLYKLLHEISLIKGIEWIRVLYTYAEEIDDNLINEMSHNEKICNYLDMPIQHISNSILKRMNRKTTKAYIIGVINKLRRNIPDIVLRTSLIVGFPGETSDDFKELCDFVSETKFDKLGVFKYSCEENTPAALMIDQINTNTKKKRENEMMKLQKNISFEINRNKIGKIYKVIIEEYDKEFYYGRSHEMSPEIDGEIIIKCDKILNVGQMVFVEIKDAIEYDLLGVVYNEFSK